MDGVRRNVNNATVIRPTGNEYEYPLGNNHLTRKLTISEQALRKVFIIVVVVVVCVPNCYYCVVVPLSKIWAS